MPLRSCANGEVDWRVGNTTDPSDYPEDGTSVLEECMVQTARDGARRAVCNTMVEGLPDAVMLDGQTRLALLIISSMIFSNYNPNYSVS